MSELDAWQSKSATVVIPTFERADMLVRAVRSALLQESVKVEVIVVDDNSQSSHAERTARVLREFRSDRLRLVQNRRSRGACGARNTGILLATHDRVAFLDDDDVLLPGSLAQQCTILTRSGAAMVYGASVVVDELFGTERIVYPPHNLTFERMIQGNCPNTSSVVIARRDVLLEVGMFDEELTSFQDYDLWLRITRSFEAVANMNPTAKFFRHRGTRTSIDIARRMEGLDRIVRKWHQEIVAYCDVGSFRKRYLQQLYHNNGNVLLASGLRWRMPALRYFTLALLNSRRGDTLRAALYLVTAACGFRAMRVAMLLRANATKGRGRA